MSTTELLCEPPNLVETTELLCEPPNLVEASTRCAVCDEPADVPYRRVPAEWFTVQRESLDRVWCRQCFERLAMHARRDRNRKRERIRNGVLYRDKVTPIDAYGKPMVSVSEARERDGRQIVSPGLVVRWVIDRIEYASPTFGTKERAEQFQADLNRSGIKSTLQRATRRKAETLSPQSQAIIDHFCGAPLKALVSAAVKRFGAGPAERAGLRRDLMEVGLDACLGAVTRYNPQHASGAAPVTFITYRVRGAITDAITRRIDASVATEEMEVTVHRSRISIGAGRPLR